MADLIIITGKLGSGKTTILNNAVKSMKKEDKAAVIVNEFAALGVDGIMLSNSSEKHVHELSNGCVCCTKGEELKETVKAIMQKHSPKTILLESSGVSSLESLIRQLSGTGVTLKGVVLVLDAYAFQGAQDFSPETKKKIRLASIIVVSKADLVSNATLERVKKAVKKVEKTVPVINSRKGSVTFKDMEKGIFKGISISEKKSPFANAMRGLFPEAFRDAESRHLARSGITSLSFETNSPVNKEKFELFISSLPSGVERVKGYVNVNGSGKAIPFNYASKIMRYEDMLLNTSTSRIVMIGKMSIPKRISLYRKLSSITTKKKSLSEKYHDLKLVFR